MEPGESQEETVVREMREELGLEVHPVAKIWECTTDDGSFLLHWWSVEIGSGELELDPREAADAQWVNASEFRALDPTFRGDLEFFERVLPSLI